MPPLTVTDKVPLAVALHEMVGGAVVATAYAAEVLEQAARRRIPVRWGGHFRTRTGKRFADGLHFELDADFYPRRKIT